MTAADGPAVIRIFDEGIATGYASMEAAAPPWETWDAAHIAECRLVAGAAALRADALARLHTHLPAHWDRLLAWELWRARTAE